MTRPGPASTNGGIANASRQQGSPDVATYSQQKHRSRRGSLGDHARETLEHQDVGNEATKLEELIARACSNDSDAARQAIESLDLLGSTAVGAFKSIGRGAAIADIRRQAIMRVADASPDEASYAEEILKTEYDETVRMAAVEVLARLAPGSSIDYLIAMMGPNDHDLRAHAADLFMHAAERGIELSDDQITQVWRAFLWAWDEAVTGVLANALAAQGDEVRRLDCLLEVLTSPGMDYLVRENFDERCAGAAINGRNLNSRSQLDAVRKVLYAACAVDCGPRLTEIYAGLITGIAWGNRQAGQLIQRALPSLGTDITEPELRPLRVEVGGAVALKPILELVEERFSAPLDELRDRSRSDWRTAAKAANVGFITRLIMSVVVFLIGSMVTFIAAWQVIFGGKGQELLGPGVSLGVGLATMLAVVYSGPLKDVRRSVQDLGRASIGFITYIHHLQFVTALFKSDYAHGRLTYSTLDKSGRLLDNAASHAVGVMTSDASNDEAPARPAPDGATGT